MTDNSGEVHEYSKQEVQGEQEEQEASNPVHQGKLKTKMIIAVLAVLVCLYVAGCIYFNDKFWPNTTMGGHDISMMSAAAAQEAIAGDAAVWELAVEGQGLGFAVPSSAIALSIDPVQSIAAAKSTVVPWLWPIAAWGSHDMGSSYAVSADKTAFEALVTQGIEAFNAGAVLPVNATVAYDKASSGFVVTKEQQGTVLDTATLVARADVALQCLDKTLVVTTEDLVKPTVFATNPALAAGRDEANTLLAVDVVVNFDGQPLYQVGSADAAQWVVFDDAYHATFSEEALAVWAAAMDASVNSVGAERRYVRPDGVTVTVSGGIYGWETEHVDWAAIVKASRDSGTQQVVDLSVNQSAAAYRGPSALDWGRYCDIDLTEQYARFYEADGSCVWESDIVTGKPYMATPEGVWMCNLKASPCTLTGQIVASTGQPAYVTTVAYWMPFVRNSIGLHDATWQSSFGGSRWEDGYGSHGCVNLPYDAAEELYGIIDVGDAVIVHW